LTFGSFRRNAENMDLSPFPPPRLRLRAVLPGQRMEYNDQRGVRWTFGEQERVMMPKLDYRNIETDIGRCGGQPVVAGTRIRVATILACYRQGMGIEEIVQQYPGLRPADVHDALAYAYDHLDEIESSLAADDEAAVKARLGNGGSVR
jgi:uncharacterized protein (DUF433 family)